MKEFIDTETTHDFISEWLTSLGISHTRLGYTYIMYALEEILYDESLKVGITKKLYPSIAVQFCTTPCAIERSIRTVINDACKFANDNMKRFIGDEIHITNKKFILKAVDFVKNGKY